MSPCTAFTSRPTRRAASRIEIGAAPQSAFRSSHRLAVRIFHSNSGVAKSAIHFAPFPWRRHARRAAGRGHREVGEEAGLAEPAPVQGASLLASCACSAYAWCMQYTIRGIPPEVDHALRASARASAKSLNEATVDALAEGAGVSGAPRKRRNLGDIAGTWKADKARDSALAAQDRVDEDLWR